MATPAVFQLHDQDVVPETASQLPLSNWIATLLTDTLSEAEPLTVVAPPTVEPVAGLLIRTDGGVASADELLTVKLRLAEEVLPDESVARAVRVCVPFADPAVFHDQDQLVVPETACHAPPSTCTATEATETLSEDVPVTLTPPLTVEPAAGAEKATAGAVVSPLAKLTLSADVVVRPLVSVAFAYSVCAPLL